MKSKGKQIIYTLRADFSTAEEDKFDSKDEAIKQYCKQNGKSKVYVDKKGRKDTLSIVPIELPHYNPIWKKKFKPKCSMTK